jgi:arylsulfatase A-like enzyme
MVANDLRLRETEDTLAELLAAVGDRTGVLGKWHLDGGPRSPGFVPPGPRRQGFACWAANECDHRHFRPSYFRDTDTPIVEHRFEPVVWTDRAIEFLKQAGDEPFFLVVAMGPPHDPYGAPEEFMRLDDPARGSPGRMQEIERIKIQAVSQYAYHNTTGREGCVVVPVREPDDGSVETASG